MAINHTDPRVAKCSGCLVDWYMLHPVIDNLAENGYADTNARVAAKRMGVSHGAGPRQSQCFGNASRWS